MHAPINFTHLPPIADKAPAQLESAFGPPGLAPDELAVPPASREGWPEVKFVFGPLVVVFGMIVGLVISLIIASAVGWIDLSVC